MKKLNFLLILKFLFIVLCLTGCNNSDGDGGNDPGTTEKAKLSSLTVSEGALSPGFDPNVTVYIVNLPWSVDSIQVGAVSSDTNGSVIINGSGSGTKSATETVDLVEGGNSVLIALSATNGVIKNHYSIIVYRAFSTDTNDATLFRLTPSQGTLSPDFFPGISAYTVEVENEVNSITLTPIPNDVNALVQVNGSTVVNGYASDPLSLSAGVNTILILVTAADNTTKRTYSLVVNRSITPSGEDLYEENDTWETAYPIGANTPISGIEGLGRAYDEDWYKIDVTAEDMRIYINSTLTHSNGNINIELYAPDGTTKLAFSTSLTDDENIDCIVEAPGTYYIKVYAFTYIGNTYDLIWSGDERPPDDNYEENDTWDTAFSLDKNTLLTSTNGPGRVYDDDWYSINVTSDASAFIINTTFTHTNSNIDIELYSTDGTTLLQRASSSNDNELMAYNASSPGTYYVRVYSNRLNGNSYNLIWRSVGAEDAYEENDTWGTAYALSKDTLLSSIDGFGVSDDEDWYSINVTAENMRIIIDCYFFNDLGDVDIVLFDTDGTTRLAYSLSTNDNEFINYRVSSIGTYFIRVRPYTLSPPNLYDLVWRGGNETDDNYEKNNTWETAYSLSEDTLLASIDGPGIAKDRDLYSIDVTEDNLRVYIDCTFIHESGNIDLELWDTDRATLLKESASFTDNEFISYVLSSPGKYYINVNSDTSFGNSYDLIWSGETRSADDNYEDNDSWDDAVSLAQDTSLSTVDGLGVLYDDDWYSIDVTSGSFIVHIDSTFIHANGDIQMELYDTDGTTRLRSSQSDTDNESIDYIFYSAGTYFIRISSKISSSNGNIYNLIWKTETFSDDNYENNDTWETAVSLVENTQLSAVDGMGYAYDDDWYSIEVTSGNMKVFINCTFTHEDGDIDMQLYDTDGTTRLNASSSLTDNEAIERIVSSAGLYYIRILSNGSTTGNTYNLNWHGEVLPSDDSYEENDTASTAYSLDENIQLSGINGLGVQIDEDWYSINVTTGNLRVLIDCTFEHLRGDVDLALYDTDGSTQLIKSESIDDDESIDHTVAAAGIYYIRIFHYSGDETYNTYDLIWDGIP
jgi:hypothetical protein